MKNERRSSILQIRLRHCVRLLVSGSIASLSLFAQQPNPADAEHLGVLTLLRQPRANESLQVDGIDEKIFVPIGGIDQWVTINGYDRKNPVLLLLHGGPGDATNPWSWRILDNWAKSFILVQWDQRGSGKTLGKSGPGISPTITIDRMTQDGIELAFGPRIFQINQSAA